MATARPFSQPKGNDDDAPTHGLADLDGRILAGCASTVKKIGDLSSFVAEDGLAGNSCNAERLVKALLALELIEGHIRDIARAISAHSVDEEPGGRGHSETPSGTASASDASHAVDFLDFSSSPVYGVPPLSDTRDCAASAPAYEEDHPGSFGDTANNCRSEADEFPHASAATLRGALVGGLMREFHWSLNDARYRWETFDIIPAFFLHYVTIISVLANALPWIFMIVILAVFALVMTGYPFFVEAAYAALVLFLVVGLRLLCGWLRRKVDEHRDLRRKATNLMRDLQQDVLALISLYERLRGEIGLAIDSIQLRDLRVESMKRIDRVVRILAKLRDRMPEVDVETACYNALDRLAAVHHQDAA
ncbi:hypothetical protein K523DRAFT_365876 [Schizophyllum commune Tattone D]|nr:hypothetical protein K523DRAFT_365876 [Schizophyllum commune Tattone D]